MDDYDKLSDEDIVEIIKSENKELYSIIIGRYQGKLLRYATNLVRNEDKASDIVQDSFIKAYVNLYGFNTKKKFSSWIYRIVHNEAINSIKKFNREVPILDDFDFISEENIEKEFEKKEMINKVKKCLVEMSILYSEPIILYYLEDKSYEEISDILRVPMGTVAIRISRAKALMKHLCQKN